MRRIMLVLFVLMTAIGSKSYRSYVEVIGHDVKSQSPDFEMLMMIKQNVSYDETERIFSKSKKEEHEYVDLGLPSGLKWATCNVGADIPEDYGDYYAWGERKTKKTYTIKNSVTDGEEFGEISGDSKYDVARVNWGEEWRMPTKTEVQELFDNCEWEWVTQKNVDGYKVTSKTNGNSIFLPATGYCEGKSFYNVGKSGEYWTSTPHQSIPNYSNSIYLDSKTIGISTGSRFFGKCVRPVTE